jgi:hypothetical protein
MGTSVAAGRSSSGRPLPIVLAMGLALVIAGCGTAAASPSPTAPPTPTPELATPTPAPTAVDTPTPSPIAVETASPTPTPAPTPTPTVAPRIAHTPAPTAAPTASPGPLCNAAQLVGAVALWETVAGGTRANVMVTTAASTSTACYMRGTVEAQMVDGGGAVIADSGPGSAMIVPSDPFFAVHPGDKFHTSVLWSNWCPKGPPQPVTVGLVLPLGLGRLVANPSGPTPVPGCVSSGSPSAVTSGRWLAGV